jgi:hypothetical protein
MSGWHTYGVILGTDTITYTFDGKPWVTINNSNVTTKKLWIGFQCAAMDPNGSAKQYETVDNGGVPADDLPQTSPARLVLTRDGCLSCPHVKKPSSEPFNRGLTCSVLHAERP